MELRIHYTALPQAMEEDRFKLELAQVLDEEGWLTGSGTSDSGFWLELELEDERANPKYGILAVKHYLQRSGFARDTAIELSGMPVGIYE